MHLMRWLLLLAGLIGAWLQAGCGVTPQSLGITGPGVPPPARAPDDSTMLPPGLPNPGTSVDPQQRYYRYN
jgi:hypothetical protein